MTIIEPTAPVEPPKRRRPQPVLWLVAMIAGLNALVISGDALNVLPTEAVRWLVLINIFVTVVGGVLVRGVVTPLAAPQDSMGRPLVATSSIAGIVKAAARVGAQGGVVEALQQRRRDGYGGTLPS
jgi:hypothetical protein